MKECFDLMPDEMRAGARTAADALKKLDNVIIAGHVNPDGDALGSMVGCAAILRALERRCVIYCPGHFPHTLDFLHLPVSVCKNLAELPFTPAGAVYLDCSEAFRLGPELASKVGNWPSVNIDHHLGGEGLGSLANYIEPQAAATAQLVAYTALELGLPLTGGLAEGIGLGLITDTGNFRHGNTTASVFHLCGCLQENGCDLVAINEKLQNNWSLHRLRLWGELFGRVQLAADNKAAWCVVYQKDLQKYFCASEDIEGFVEWLRRIKGIKAGVLLREESNGKCKFSLRSSGNTDVRAMAASLGGGGHFNAAGGTLDMPVPVALATLLATVERALV